jgi:TM2 domain-containing membrane protein YozV
VFSFVDWWRMTAPGRSKRVSLSLAVLLGLAGFAAGLIFGISPFLLGCILAGTCLVVQIASPLGEGGTDGSTDRQQENKLRAQAAPGNATAVRLVPPWARMLWLLCFAILLGLGLILLIWTGMARLNEDEFVLAVSFGIGGLIFATFCLAKAFKQRYVSLYRYLIKPLLLLICLQSVVTASICLGSWRLGDDEILVALFFIIFPAILFFVIAFVRSTTVEAMMGKMKIEAVPAYAGEVVSAFKRMWALLLSGGMFLGIFGLHRFYVGKIGTGIVWLLTFGLFGIGQVIDISLICVGQFKDCNGARLIIWQSRDELRRVSMGNRPNAAAQANGPVVAAGVPEQPQADQPGPVASAPVVMPTTAYEPFNPFGFLLSFVGYLLLLLALVIGLGLALHLTWLVAAGFPDQHLAEELQEEFGYAGWPQLVERIAFVVGAGVYMLAAAFIIVARRHRGAVHMIRGAFGLLGMLLCLWALSGVFPIHIYKQVDLVNSFEQEQIGKALDLLFGRADEGAAVWSAIFFIGSVIILAWPPRRSQPQLITTVQNLGAN